MGGCTNFTYLNIYIANLFNQIALEIIFCFVLHTNGVQCLRGRNFDCPGGVGRVTKYCRYAPPIPCLESQVHEYATFV